MNDHYKKDVEYHDSIAHEYDKVVVAPRQLTNDVVYKQFTSLIRPASLMLDLACGTGHMSLRFSKFFKKIIAVDHSSAMLRQAKANAAAKGIENIEFFTSSVFDFLEGYSSQSFDLIVSTGFLHHLLPSQLESLLRRLRDLAIENGKLLISEPIEIPCGSMPPAIKAWNARSIATKLVYTAAADEPDEAPIKSEVLLQLLSESSWKVLRDYRNWEIFPKSLPPSLYDWLMIRTLNLIFGKRGNVFTLLAEAGC